MSTETPLAGTDLAGLVADGTLTTDDIESTLTKLGHAVKRRMYITVTLYRSGDRAVVKIYPLGKVQAEYLNQKAGETVYVPAGEWRDAYDTNPVT